MLFVVVALTDWLDGWLPARRLNMTSSFGAFLDPVADKFLVCAALLVLVHPTACMRWWRWSSSAARSRSRRCANGWRRSAPRAASRVHMVGKIKTVVQMVAIPFLLFDGRLFGVIDTRTCGARC